MGRGTGQGGALGFCAHGLLLSASLHKKSPGHGKQQIS